MGRKVEEITVDVNQDYLPQDLKRDRQRRVLDFRGAFSHAPKPGPPFFPGWRRILKVE
jgi:hypothetical protein